MIGRSQMPAPVSVSVLIDAKVQRFQPSAVDDIQTHLFSYRFDGKLWELEIKARNAEEAKARLARLAFAKYNGVLVATVQG